jgi:DAK2 domain fusion protein YloV
MGVIVTGSRQVVDGIAPLASIDAEAVCRWIAAAELTLTAHRDEIDSLNVFPVADADTGTNLVATIRAAAEAVRAHPQSSAAATLQVAAQAAVLAAQGNSGVIVAQILRGVADGFDGALIGDGRCLRRALKQASEYAYAVVGDPCEGTLLTVIRAAATAATGNDLGEVVRGAVTGAVAALRRTPDQLKVLARAGVVDAGGRGLVLLLDALAVVVLGESVAPPGVPRVLRSRRALEAGRETGSGEFAFEVQYLIDTDEESIARLRTELAAMGDSVAVAGTGNGSWNVHVHVNDVGAAIEAGLGAGQPRRITVVHFAEQQAAGRLSPDQVSSDQWNGGRADGAVARDERTGTCLLALAPGAGLGHMFAGEGVLVIEDDLAGDESAVLAVIRGSGAARVVLLPNISVADTVAEPVALLARAEGVDVVVVPTRSPLQALAAVAVHDAGRWFADDVVTMAEAAAATRFAEVRVAEAEGLTTIGLCREGDVLGLIDGEVVQIGRSVTAVALGVTDRLLGTGGELITVLLGRDCVPDVGEVLRGHIGHVAPLTEVVLYQAGQASCPLLIGME